MNHPFDADGRAWERLPYLGLLRFAGPDAVAFLQGQVSNDTRPLRTGETVLAAYSSPQGRVLAVLHLLPHSSGVLAVLPREIALPTLERLRKYVLRSKVVIEDLSERFAVLGRHVRPEAGAAAPAAPAAIPVDPGARRAYVEHEGIGVAAVCSAGGGGREWAVGELQDLERHGLVQDSRPAPQAECDWRLADIRAGLPQVYAATRELFVAQMLNLDLLDGISFTKGCYTGQEIVARTQHLGRIKRRMHHLRLPPGTWAVGQAFQLTDGRTGRLTDLARTAEGFEALAVLSLNAGGASAVASAGAPVPGTTAAALAVDALDAESLSTPRIDATELPLPYSFGPLGALHPSGASAGTPNTPTAAPAG
jgi:folate-binding protein YgfZ